MTRSPLAEVIVVTVTYHPDLAQLERQVLALRGVGQHWLVDNASDPAERAGLQRLAANHAWLRLLSLEENLGLAAAVNQAVAQLPAMPASTCLLLLDQDTDWTAEALPGLLAGLDQVTRASGVPCMVGPALHDPATGMNHGFHAIEAGRWVRRQPPAGSRTAVPAASINGSGSLLPLQLFRQVGGLEADFFIDHVDTEFSFRLVAAGVQLWGIPWVQVDHAMGERGRRIWLLGWRLFPDRSPARHAYLYRNTVRLLRRTYVPRVWKFWAVLKLLLTALLCLLYDPRRGAQWRAMGQGVRAGLRDHARVG
ncbi:glycosyltransferase [Frateuria aurantia]